MVHARNEFDQRRFTGAIVTEQANHLAGIDFQAHMIDGHQATKVFIDILDLQDRGFLTLTVSRRSHIYYLLSRYCVIRSFA